MEIDKDILFECICHLYDYNFSDLLDYSVRKDLGDWYILATVLSADDISEFYVGRKSVDVTIDEYQRFVRRRKLDVIKKSIL